MLDFWSPVFCVCWALTEICASEFSTIFLLLLPSVPRTSSVGRWAGLSRSIEIFVGRPFMSTVNSRSLSLSITRCGPEYGLSRIYFRIPSLRTKTCVQVCNSLKQNVFLRPWYAAATGLSSCMWIRKSSKKKFGSWGGFSCVKNSPGILKVVP